MISWYTIEKPTLFIWKQNLLEKKSWKNHCCMSDVQEQKYVILYRKLQCVSVFIWSTVSSLNWDQMKIWSGTCGRSHSVFMCGFVCTQLSHQADWQSRTQDGDLFNEARGERGTEGPDYKQTKHFNRNSGQQCGEHSSASSALQQLSISDDLEEEWERKENISC